MKKIILYTIIFNLSSVLPCFPSPYKILYVKGKIINHNSNKLLMTGDIISSSDSLNFVSNEATCFLISNNKIRLSLQSTKNGLVKDVFSSIPSRKVITTRGNENANITKLSNYFIEKQYTFIDTIESIKLDRGFFDSNNVQCEYILNFKDSLGKDHRKKLSLEDSTLTLNIHDFAISNKIHEFNSVQVFQVSPVNGLYKNLISFSAKYYDINDLTESLVLIKDSCDKDETGAFDISEFHSIFCDVYGFTNITNLKTTLLKTGLIK
jgi:hypothetical protein